MTSWKDLLNGDPLPWLLERDSAQPAVRYFALRDIMAHDENDDQVKEAKAAIMSAGPVPAILAAQEADGYWNKPGAGYGPKYYGTQWAVIFLAQLGADGNDPGVRAGCEYILSHAISSIGSFSMNGTPSGFVQCMSGNLGAALIDLGRVEDPRLQTALEWLAQTVTGDGVADPTDKNTAIRYYKSGTVAPSFACSANIGLPCAWGAVKTMLALSKVPPALLTKRMHDAIEQGVAFILSHDPAIADYPFGMGNKPSSSWFKFGYPIGYITDVLQNLEVLAASGQAGNPVLANALDLVLKKQDAHGRWPLEYSYAGKTWADVEKLKHPSKWVTLRALRVLK
ncbi:MAG: nitrogen fixation protein NifH, partial [Dehalococcoidia bacterium]